MFLKKNLIYSLVICVSFTGFSIFANSQPEKYAVGILLDQSTSITLKGALDAKQRIRRLLEKSKYFRSLVIWSFDRNINKLTEISGEDFQNSKLGIQIPAHTLKKGRQTILFDALRSMQSTLKQQSGENFAVIFLFTDGWDEDSKLNLPELKAYSESVSIPVYIFPTDGYRGINRYSLYQIASSTQGKLIRNNSKKISQLDLQNLLKEGIKNRKFFEGTINSQENSGQLTKNNSKISSILNYFEKKYFRIPLFFWFLGILLIAILLLFRLLRKKHSEQFEEQQFKTDYHYHEDLSYHRIHTNLQKSRFKKSKKKPLVEQIFEDSPEKNQSVKSLKERLKKKKITLGRTKIQRKVNALRPKSLSYQIKETEKSSSLYERNAEQIQKLPENAGIGSQDNYFKKIFTVPENLKENPAKFDELGKKALQAIFKSNNAEGIELNQMDLIFEWIRTGCLGPKDFYRCLQNEKSVDLLIKFCKEFLENKLSSTRIETFEALLSGKGYEIDKKNIEQFYEDREQIVSHQPQQTNYENLDELIELTKNSLLKEPLFFSLSYASENAMNFQTEEIQLDKVLFISDHDLKFDREYFLKFSNEDEIRSGKIKHKEVLNSKFKYFYKLQILN